MLTIRRFFAYSIVLHITLFLVAFSIIFPVKDKKREEFFARLVSREELLPPAPPISAIPKAMPVRPARPKTAQQVLAKEGRSYEKYREATRSDLIKMRIMQREIRPRVSVTNEEIGLYYQEHRDEYEGKLRVRLQMIALPVPVGGDPAVKEEQPVKAQTILKRIRAGEPFEALANEFTPGPARTGGDIGYVEKGSLNPAIEEVAFSLKPGEISDVIETPQGLYIIRALDRRGGGSLSAKATREDVEERIYRDKMEKKYDEWVVEKRQNGAC